MQGGAMSYIPSPYKDAGMRADFRTKIKRPEPRGFTAPRARNISTHIWGESYFLNGPVFDGSAKDRQRSQIYQCLKCKKPRFLVEFKKCTAKEKKS